MVQAVVRIDEILGMPLAAPASVRRFAATHPSTLTPR